jgi:hypothetical protein
VSLGQRYALVLIVAVALALRIGWCVVAAEHPRVGDPATYYIYGVQIGEGRGYNSAAVTMQQIADAPRDGRPPADNAVPTALFPPGYPATLGGLYWLMLHTPLPENLVTAAVALNVVLGVATVLLAFVLVRRLFDSRAALVAAALLAVYPNLVFHTATLHWETTFVFLTMAALVVLLGRPWGRGRVPTPRLVAFAMLVGASVLVRPMSVGMVAAMVVACLVAGAGVRRSLLQCGVVLGIVALMVTPWTVRNLVKLDSPVVISTELGAALCVSRQPGARGNKDFSRMHRYCIPSMEGVPLDEREVRENDYALARARAWVADHPLQEARFWFSRGRYAFREDHDALDDAVVAVSSGTRTALGRVADWFWFAVLGLGAVGVVRFADRSAPQRLVIALTALALALTPIVLYGAPRYKVPATPLVAMMAAVCVVALVDRMRSR